MPNRAARTLVTQRTDSVALVVFESGERFFAEPFFGRIVQSISGGAGRPQPPDGPDDRAGARGTAPAGGLPDPPARRRRAAALAARRRPAAARCSRSGASPPCGPADRRTPQRGTFVDADNRGGAREAVAYLRRQGRRLHRRDHRPARHGGRHRPARRLPRRGRRRAGRVRRLQRGERRRRHAAAARVPP